MSETENAEAVAATETEQQNGTVDNVESTPTQDEQNTESSTVQTDEVIKTENTQKRFNELTSTIKAQQEEINRLKQQGSIEYTDPGAPKAEDFETEEEFIRADAAYQATKNVVGMFNKQAELRTVEEQQRETQQKLESYSAKIPDVIKRIPDFEQVVSNSMLDEVDVNGNLTPATQAILAAENGPDIAAHIAKNPELAMQLNRANPIDVAMTVARLDNSLTVDAPKFNEAPEPIGSETVNTGVVTPTDDLSSKVGRYTIKRS